MGHQPVTLISGGNSLFSIPQQSNSSPSLLFRTLRDITLKLLNAITKIDQFQNMNQGNQEIITLVIASSVPMKLLFIWNGTRVNIHERQKTDLVKSTDAFISPSAAMVFCSFTRFNQAAFFQSFDHLLFNCIQCIFNSCITMVIPAQVKESNEHVMGIPSETNSLSGLTKWSFCGLNIEQDKR